MNSGQIVPATGTGCSQWTEIAQSVAAGSAEGMEKLYASLEGLRGFFSRVLGREQAQDAYQELMVVLAKELRTGRLRDPNRLPSFALTIARRYAAEQRKRESRFILGAGDDEPDRAPSPEQRLSLREHTQIARRILTAMPARDREVLVRFYVWENSAEDIQEQLGITAAQFRQIKHRAKKRFAQLCHAATCQSAG